MNINATLIGQMIAFGLLVWFTMKLVWPHIIGALEERQTKIADGLAAGERGQHELELAQKKVGEQLREVKMQSAEIIEQANKRSAHMVDEAKEKARDEGRRIVDSAKIEIEQEANSAKRALREEFAATALMAAEKILSREVDANTHNALLEDMIKDI